MEEELELLSRENCELKRANGILKTASVFSQRNSTTLRSNGLPHRRVQGAILGRGPLPSPKTSRSWIFHLTRLPKTTSCVPSARALSDSLFIPEIQRVHAENVSVYGIYTMWHAKNREGFHIGRNNAARLMKLAGVSGRRRIRNPVTTISPKVLDPRLDLVQRNFRATAPGRPWGADITYVRTLSGFAYTAFLVDVYSRKIVGVATRSTMRTDAWAMEALEHGLTTAGRNSWKPASAPQ